MLFVDPASSRFAAGLGRFFLERSTVARRTVDTNPTRQ
jgi:hypothetical protein